MLGLAVSWVLAGMASVTADDLAAAINSLRSPSLALSAEASRVAGRSASAQAAAGSLFHTDLSGILGVCTSAGEVVGSGPDVPAIIAGFRGSPSHMGIITNSRWTSMGTGQARGGDGALYVSVVFCEQDGQPPPANPPSTAPAAPASPAPPGSPAPAPLEAEPDGNWLPEDAPHDWVVGVCWGLDDRDRSLDVERAALDAGTCPQIS